MRGGGWGVSRRGERRRGRGGRGLLLLTLVVLAEE